MRDDVPGLSAWKFTTLPAAPAKATPLPRPVRSGLPSFGSSLSRATSARAAAPKPYISPMAGKNAPATNPQAKPSTPPTLSRPPTSLSTPPKGLAAGSTWRPPTPVVRPRPTVQRPAPAPAPQTASIVAAATPPGTPLPLSGYPRPKGDNGRGMHWIPTTSQSPAAVDRFVAEAQRMGVKWVTFLNNGAATGDNDYLVSKLVGAGIQPIMRLYSPTIAPMGGDIEGMVRHYSAMGVHYFQPFNEPNLNCENPDGKVSVDRYLDAWLPAAQAIVRGGGLPGFGSMAPGGDFDDQKFLQASLDGLKARGQLGALDNSWLSMHNYTWNHPIEDRGDGDGFFKFRAYDTMLRNALGRDLPIIGTEGGTFEGQQEDPRMPAVTAAMAASWTHDSMQYLRDKREPWLLASSVWTIADLAGGGGDARFEAQALFKADGRQSSIVGALQNLA